jgi:hypothetical protein
MIIPALFMSGTWKLSIFCLNGTIILACIFADKTTVNSLAVKSIGTRGSCYEDNESTYYFSGK